MVLATPTGQLHGSLRLPAGADAATAVPVALIVAGSGPTDRDGNSAALPGTNDSLKMLADALAELGVASLRYDKRGIGQSAAAAPPESEMTFDLLVDDAVGWLEALAGDARFGPRVVVGHSEGSLIGMLAARRAGADAFVSLEGAGRRAADVLRGQLAAQLPAALLAEIDTVLAELEAGRLVPRLPPGIAAVPGVGQALFRDSVQPYLVSWFRLDPAQAIGELDVPCLIVQGSTDLQVTSSDAERLADAARTGTLASIEGMNHVLKAAPADRAANLATYTDPAAPLADGLTQALRGFLERALPAS